MGTKAVIIISLEKNTAFARSFAVWRINPILLITLNAGIPTSRAFLSSATKRPSTITTAPSIIIPKSIAPIESRLALMPMARRQIKAKSSANGMIMDTITVVRQSAIKINTMKVTSKIPSIRLCVTVRTARSTRSSRS